LGGRLGHGLGEKQLWLTVLNEGDLSFIYP
jgi:hypothetical protein